MYMVNDSVGWFSFFRENRQFQIFWASSKNYHRSIKNNSHLENRPSFQNYKKNWLGDFQGK